MDRIQSALEQARARREGTPRTDRKTGVPGHKSAVADDVAEAWDRLASFEPDPALMERNRIVAIDRGAPSAHVDLLRTRALLMMRDKGWTRLAITSPNMACGKTTTSLNLAYSIARQQDQRVILIEMDMRKPNQLKMLGLTHDMPQFSRVLEGRDPAEPHLRRLRANLAVGGNRTSVMNPSELMQSTGLKTVLDEVEATYQPTVMIFDMPPIMVSDDVMGFVDNVDCVLLMAAAGITSIKEIDDCERELSERTNVLGVVLNKCRYMGSLHYDYYYG